MVRIKLILAALVILFGSAYTNAQTTYVINQPQGNVVVGNTVGINWAFTSGHSLMATFSSNGGSGSPPDTITDTGGNIYTLIKNAVGTPIPLGVGGFSQAWYVCLYPVNTTIGVNITGPLSGGITYAYLIEWYICPWPGGCSTNAVPANSHIVTDKVVWNSAPTVASFTSVQMPSYGGTIPIDGVSVGMFQTSDSSFYYPFTHFLSPILGGGWDVGTDAYWGMGWVGGDPSQVTLEDAENTNDGFKIFASYGVFHFEPNSGPPTPSVKSTAISVFIG